MFENNINRLNVEDNAMYSAGSRCKGVGRKTGRDGKDEMIWRITKECTRYYAAQWMK